MYELGKQSSSTFTKKGLQGIEWVILGDHSGGSMHVRTLRRRYSSSRRSVGASLEDADFVVEAFDEAKRDFVFRLAVGGDAVPVAVDHIGEALVGSEALPFEAGSPVVEEAPRPALAPVVPELAEGLLEDIGGVEALVGGQQNLEGAFTLQGEVFMARQQIVLLPLDEASILAAEAGVFGLAHLVERLAEMAHDVKLVEQDRGFWRFVLRDVAERFPHIHHGEFDFTALFRAQPIVESRHAGLGTIRAAVPDRSFANQVADHDAIAVPLAD